MLETDEDLKCGGWTENGLRTDQDGGHADLPVWKQSNGDLMLQSAACKSEGVDLFKQDRVRCAFRKFSRALKLQIMLQQDQLDETEKKDLVVMKLSSYLNISACQLKTGKYEHVVANCTKALLLDHDNLKALYRRAVAYTGLQDYELAKQDLQAALTLDPGNKAASQQLDIVRSKTKELDQLYSAAMKKMFG